ncbi:response regulator [Leptothermofonsia sichuanensis E412]|uniref:response regulator n=1 Tax=Leptothermofonsia sichuanensis TaxID=2917832 RepID=UPI001CA63B7E|nr:response regulator [Leptothermofonsia sichuanensis]QZZ19679.1 response regulator [Leptothermofonsia sichuanensis E412]
MNILLIDDDAILAKGTAKLIQRLGHHHVIITDDPQEIISRCQSGEVDLVLMDVNIPGAEWEGQEVSGADLARHLKEHAATAHIPIILITAYAMLSERQALMEASHADGFCAKPVTDYKALLDMIDRLGNRVD